MRGNLKRAPRTLKQNKILKFTDMRTFNFFDYLPQKYQAIKPEDNKVRTFIYNFKDGYKETAIQAAQLVCNLLWRWYSHNCSEYTIACVPASSEKEYRHRFSYFAAIIANNCCEENAMKHIHVIGQREAKHRVANHIVSEDNYCISLDNDFFAGRKVIIFDDLITTGTTARKFETALKSAGAEVKGGLFLGRTVKGIYKNSFWGRFAAHSLYM